MVSQFVSPEKVRLLRDLDYDFPEGTHAVGRLDNNSEGLLIVTTNKKVTRLLFQGEVPHKRTYLVSVRHSVSEESLHKLRTGVTIRLKEGGDYLTPPCEVNMVEMPGGLFQRPKKVDHVPCSWLTMTLYEGKYHQVRKMIDAAGHHCVRLIRLSIEDLELGDLPPGGVREIEEREFFRMLRIENWE